MDVLQSFGVFGVFAADGPLGWRGVLASAAVAERGVGFCFLMIWTGGGSVCFYALAAFIF